MNDKDEEAIRKGIPRASALLILNQLRNALHRKSCFMRGVGDDVDDVSLDASTSQCTVAQIQVPFSLYFVEGRDEVDEGHPSGFLLSDVNPLQESDFVRCKVSALSRKTAKCAFSCEAFEGLNKGFPKDLVKDLGRRVRDADAFVGSDFVVCPFCFQQLHNH